MTTVREHASPLMVRREASVSPESFNADANTVDVAWTTGARVFRQPFFGEGFMEELSTEPGHVRLDRLNSGAPFLRAHDSFTLDAILGVVERGSAKVSDGIGTATIRLSKEESDREIVNKIRDGIIRNVSVGYSIHRTETRDGVGEGAPKIVRAVDWEPHEISAVPIGADPGAGVRSIHAACGLRGESLAAALNDAIDAKATDDKPRSDVIDEMASAAGISASTVGNIISGTNINCPPLDRLEGFASSLDVSTQSLITAAERDGCDYSDDDADRSATTNGDAMSTEAAPQTQTIDLDAERQKARDAEKARAAGIRATVRSLKLDSKTADEMIASDVELDAARAKLIEMRAAKDDADAINPQTEVSPGAVDNVIKRHECMVKAIMHRYRPGRFKIEQDERMWVGRSLPEMARASLEMHGKKTDGWSKWEVAKRALAMNEPLQMRHAIGALHTTDDFPIVLQDAINKTLMRAYDETERTYVPWTVQASAPDFRTQHKIRFGEAPNLLEIDEHGEFTRGTIEESEETYALRTYGRIVGLSRQMIVNDDMGAFMGLSEKFGSAAARREQDIVYAVLTANADMSDGNALFDAATHGNNIAAGGGGAPSVGELGDLRTLARTQTGLDGTSLINVGLRWMLVPAALETPAEQFLSDLLNPNVDGEVTPRSMRSVGLIVEPRLDADSTDIWYATADPGQFDTVEWAHLEGEEGVRLESLNGWDQDGIEFKARLDFEAAATDWRGLYRNEGT